MSRGVTSLLLAFALTATSLGGAVLHLCGMEETLEARCCCEGDEQKAPPKLESADECCGEALAQGEHPPVGTSESLQVERAPLVAALGVSVDRESCASAAASWLPFARGPPSSHGPPLFIQHCSFLN